MIKLNCPICQGELKISHYNLTGGDCIPNVACIHRFSKFGHTIGCWAIIKNSEISYTLNFEFKGMMWGYDSSNAEHLRTDILILEKGSTRKIAEYPKYIPLHNK